MTNEDNLPTLDAFTPHDTIETTFGNQPLVFGNGLEEDAPVSQKRKNAAQGPTETQSPLPRDSK